LLLASGAVYKWRHDNENRNCTWSIIPSLTESEMNNSATLKRLKNTVVQDWSNPRTNSLYWWSTVRIFISQAILLDSSSKPFLHHGTLKYFYSVLRHPRLKVDQNFIEIFYLGTPFVLLNGTLVYLSMPVRNHCFMTLSSNYFSCQKTIITKSSI